MSELGYRYRYYDRQWGGYRSLELDRYPVVRRTPSGAWIAADFGERFVLDGPGRRFAHETEELAYESFKLRKRRQLRLMRAWLDDLVELQDTMERQRAALLAGGRYSYHEDNLGVLREALPIRPRLVGRPTRGQADEAAPADAAHA